MTERNSEINEQLKAERVEQELKRSATQKLEEEKKEKERIEMELEQKKDLEV